jgi:hypothetical protein
VTHGVDMNQRVIRLDVSRQSGCVNITAPSANVAPPGWYMLFLLNDQGIPSVAKFVKLRTGAGGAPCGAPPLPDDTTDPTVAITAPSTGMTVKGEVTVRASATDNDVVAGVQFSSDGQPLGPEDPMAPFSATWDTTKTPNGKHTLTALARDAAGNTAAVSVEVTVDNSDAVAPGGGPAIAPNLTPAIAQLRLSRATFRRGAGTQIRFSLSEAAKVSLTFERMLKGRRVRGRCVKPTAGRRANCTRYAGGKVVEVQAKAGANTVPVGGRLVRALAVGRYRLTLVATDATGKRSAAARASLRLLERAVPARGKAALAAALSWF